MAKINLDMTAVQEERQSKVDFIKAGNYNVKIIDTEVKETKTGGYMLNVYFEVIDGQFKGARVMDRMNIVNNSADAVKIGLARLKLIARLAGVKNPNKVADSNELHGGKMMASVVEDKYTNEKGNTYDTNKITGYEELTVSEQPVQAKTETAVVESTEQKKFPWQK